MTRRDALAWLGMALAGFTTPLHAAPPAAASGASPLITRRIPSSGIRLPAIGLGTWQSFDAATAEERQALLEVLAAFVEMGGSVIDSSPMYGRSEEVAGSLAAQLGIRDKLFIATKVWTSGKQAGVRQMEESMRKLQARPIDLMQVHNLVDVDTHLATLREWKQAGIVRHIGITHYTASAHDEVARIVAAQPLDFVQINYSVAERDAERRLLPLAQERGVAVIANRPFASGDLFRRLRGKPLPGWAAEIDCGSWAQVLLKFVISHPALTCAIPATSKPTHLRDNMQAAYGRLPDARLRARIVQETEQA